MEYKRILAIGDIHGEWEKFISLYEKIHFNPDEDLLIFLGDYVDRGPKPLHVLDWMYEHRNEKNMIMLRGNHEQMMLDYYKDGDNLWVWNGGDRTRKALERQKEGVLEKSLSFLESLPLYYHMTYNGKEMFFCHAGIMPDIPLEQQKECDLLWIREDFYDVYDGDALVVVGHTPVTYLDFPPEPVYFRDRNIIMVDTGSFLEDGFISCVDVLSGQFVRSDPGKNRRERRF